MTAPARVGDVLAMPAVLSAHELAEFCRRCRCVRGEHRGRLGTNCPGVDGRSAWSAETFEPSGDYSREPVDEWNSILP